MKILALILCVLLETKAAIAVVALPPAVGTNALVEFYRANSINTALNNGYYCIGRMDRLERELDRLKSGFLILAILIGSSLASLCALAVRDQIRKQKESPERSLEMDVNKLRNETTDAT